MFTRKSIAKIDLYLENGSVIFFATYTSRASSIQFRLIKCHYAESTATRLLDFKCCTRGCRNPTRPVKARISIRLNFGIMIIGYFKVGYSTPETPINLGLADRIESCRETTGDAVISWQRYEGGRRVSLGSKSGRARKEILRRHNLFGVIYFVGVEEFSIQDHHFFAQNCYLKSTSTSKAIVKTSVGWLTEDYSNGLFCNLLIGRVSSSMATAKTARAFPDILLSSDEQECFMLT